MRNLARAYIQSGREAEAYELFNELKQMYEESDIGNTALYTASLYLALGDKDQASEWLERANERRDPLLIAINIWIFPDHISQDPRLKAILEKIGLDQ